MDAWPDDYYIWKKPANLKIGKEKEKDSIKEFELFSTHKLTPPSIEKKQTTITKPGA